MARITSFSLVAACLLPELLVFQLPCLLTISETLCLVFPVPNTNLSSLLLVLTAIVYPSIHLLDGATVAFPANVQRVGDLKMPKRWNECLAILKPSLNRGGIRSAFILKEPGDGHRTIKDEVARHTQLGKLPPHRLRLSSSNCFRVKPGPKVGPLR